MKHNAIKINNFNVSNDLPFFLIAGPCSIESKDHAIDHAGKINEICKQLNLNFVYKSSFDKANRSSSLSSRGVGIDQGLKILSDVKKTFPSGIESLTTTPISRTKNSSSLLPRTVEHDEFNCDPERFRNEPCARCLS